MDFKSLAVLCILVAPTSGFYPFRQKIPNGEIVPHPCKPNYMWAGVGHMYEDGGRDRNPFGEDFDKAGKKWTKDLCRKDSDGDGMSNGEELGDPDCRWVEGSIPDRTKGITHPGVCTPYNEGICSGRDQYVNCEIQVVRECKVINNPEVRHMDFRFSKITIPPTETNYFCQYFDLPTDQDYHIVADDAVLDNNVVTHHFLLFGCPEDYKEKPTDYVPNPCYMGGDQKSCNTLIGFWAVGYEGSCYGEHVGYRIGRTGFKKVKLEVHYNNPELVSGYTDTSGLRVYYRPAMAGVQDLATLVVGQMQFEIPPGERDVEVSAVCPQHCSRAIITKPLYLLSAINHMHYMGRSQKTEISREGQTISVIADDPRYNYDSPTPYKQSTPLKIQPGDDIKTTCLYSSMSRKQYVYFGDGTLDEMCFSFLTVYPAEALPSTSWCVSFGPLSTCERFTGTPKFNCDWARFSNLSNPEMIVHYLNLEAHCSMDGLCRPECKKYVDDLMKHPCLKHRGMERLVSEFLQSYKEGARFLGRLHSCSMRNKEQALDCDAQCPRDQDTCGEKLVSTDTAVCLSTPHSVAMTIVTSLVTMVTLILSN